MKEEDLPVIRAAIEAAVVAKYLGPFLQPEEQDAASMRDAGLQAKAAQVSLRARKFPPEEYNALDGGNGVNARRACVAAEVTALDAATRALIMDGLPKELREYVLPHKTASAMWAALPKFFGGASQEAQLNAKADLSLCVYKFSADGFGARTLVQTVVGLGKRLVQAGGSHTDADTMQTVISKFVLVRDGVDAYNANTTLLLSNLNNGQLTIDKLRQDLIAAEKRIAIKDAERGGAFGGEVAPEGAMVTRTGGAAGKPVPTFTPEQLEVMTALVTKAVKQGFKGRVRGDNKKPRGENKEKSKDKLCFNFRDTGECEFGDKCRFAH